MALVDEAILGAKGPHGGDAGDGLGEVAVNGRAAGGLKEKRAGGTGKK